MNRSLKYLTAGSALAVATGIALAQGPGRGPGPGGPGDGGVSLSKEADAKDLATRMLGFDKNGDGVLTKDEVTDERLVRLYGRADANNDGKVTKAELIALGEKEHAEGGGFGGPGGGPGFGPPGGGPGFGPPGGGPGGRMQMPRFRPGEILPQFVSQRLELTDEQTKQIAALQKDVDSKLEKILTSEQNGILKEMRDRGPGRGPGGPPGAGGPGAPPPPQGGRDDR